MALLRLNPLLGAQAERSAEVQHACMTKAEKGAAYAQSIAPVLTGEYRDSIHAESTAEGARIVADSDHAAYVEAGTSDTPAFHVLAKAGEALEHL